MSGMSKSKRAKKQRRLFREILEDRQLLTVSSVFDQISGHLSIQTDDADEIAIFSDAGFVRINGEDPGGDPVPAELVQSIFAEAAGDFPNRISAESVNPDTFPALQSLVLFGGEGDDELIAGQLDTQLIGGFGNDLLFGQNGNDFFDAGGEQDSSFGGLGDDVYLLFGGEQFIADEGGLDTLDFSLLDSGIQLSSDLVGTQQHVTDSLFLTLESGPFENIVGTGFADTIQAEMLPGGFPRSIHGGFPRFDEMGEPIPDVEDTLLYGTLGRETEVLADGPSGQITEINEISELGPIFFDGIDFVTPITPPDPNLVVTGTSDDDVLTIIATSPNSGTWSLVKDADNSTGQRSTENGTFSDILSFRFDGLNGDDRMIINNTPGVLLKPVDGVLFEGGAGTDDLELDTSSTDDISIGIDSSDQSVFLDFDSRNLSASTDVVANSVAFVRDKASRKHIGLFATNSSAENIALTENVGEQSLVAVGAEAISYFFQPPSGSLSLSPGPAVFSADTVNILATPTNYTADISIHDWDRDSVNFKDPGILTSGKLTVGARFIDFAGFTQVGQFDVGISSTTAPTANISFSTDDTRLRAVSTSTLQSQTIGMMDGSRVEVTAGDLGVCSHDFTVSNVTASGDVKIDACLPGSPTTDSIKDAGDKLTDVVAHGFTASFYGHTGNKPGQNVNGESLETAVREVSFDGLDNSSNFSIDNSVQGSLNLKDGKAAAAFVLNQSSGGVDITGEIQTQFTLGVTQNDSASTGDDIRVRNGAVLENGVTFLSAGDNIDVEPSASIASTSHAAFVFNFKTDVDNTSGHAYLDGSISASNYVRVTGGDREDIVRINAKTAKVTELDTKGGTDEVQLLGSPDADSFRFEPQGTQNKVGTLFGPSLIMDNAEKLTIDGKAGGDAFQVFPSNNMEVQIKGDAPTIAPGDTLEVDAGGRTFLHAIHQQFVTVAGAQPVHYTGIEAMALRQGRATFVGSEADERFVVDATHLDGIHLISLPTGLTVETDALPSGFNGGGGEDEIEFFLSDADDDVHLRNSLATVNQQDVELAGFGAVHVDLGGGNDAGTVHELTNDSLRQVRLSGNNGDDEFNVWASELVAIDLLGEGGTNTFVAHGAVTDNGDGELAGEGLAPIRFTGVTNVNIPLSNVLSIDGTSGNDVLVVHATANDAGTYQLNAGPVKTFSGISVFSFDAKGGDDRLEINNPSGGIFDGGGSVQYIAEPHGNNANDLMVVKGGKATEIEVQVDSALGTMNLDFDGNLAMDAKNLHKMDLQMKPDRLRIISDSNRAESIRVFPNRTDDKVDFQANTGLPFELQFDTPTLQLLVISEQGPTPHGADTIAMLEPKSAVPYTVSAIGDTNDIITLAGGHVTSGALVARAGKVEATGTTTAGSLEIESLSQGVLLSSTTDASGNRIAAELRSPGPISIEARSGDISMQADTFVTTDQSLSMTAAKDIDIAAIRAKQRTLLTSRQGSIISSDTGTPQRPNDIDVWSPDIEFVAATNVGLFLNPIQTIADNIEGVATAGEFAITNEADLNVGNAGLGQVTGVTAQRVSITTEPFRGTGSGKGKLTISESVKASDTFNSLRLVSSGQFQSQDQDLVIKAGATVENTQGDVVLDVGSDFLAEPGSRLRAAGSVAITTRSADPTPNHYELRGEVKTPVLEVTAGLGNDTLVVSPGTSGLIQDTYSVGRTTLNLRAGNDTIEIDDRFGSHLNAVIRVEGDTGTDDLTLNSISTLDRYIQNDSVIVGAIGGPAYTVEYADVEFLEVNTSAGKDYVEVEPSKDTAITVQGSSPSSAPGDRLLIKAPKREVGDLKQNSTTNRGSFDLAGYETLRFHDFEEVKVSEVSSITGSDADEIITVDISPDGSTAVHFAEQIGGTSYLMPAMPISIDGGAGSNEVRFRWLGEDQTFQMSAHEFAIPALAAVELLNVDRIVAIGGSGNDQFEVQASLMTPIHIQGGGGNNGLVVSVPEIENTVDTGEAVIAAGFQPVEFGGVTLNNIQPQPLPAEGDLNRDGQIDVKDIDFFYLGLANQTTEAMFDMSLDGLIDQNDAKVWVEDIMNTRFGDTDLDGDVDFGDFLALSSNFGKQGHWADGNFDGAGTDGNGRIEFADFLLLSSNFGFNRP